jgi:hypothetical protein
MRTCFLEESGMKIIYNGIYLVSMIILIYRSYRTAKADNFEEGAYPAKGKTTWKDSVLFVVLMLSYNLAMNLYPIKWLTAPFLGVLVAFYTWTAVQHYRIYKRVKPILFVIFFWIIVVVANVITWNRLTV